VIFIFFSNRRRHTRSKRDWSSDVCSSDLAAFTQAQLHTPLPKFSFLTRDALIKSALLHASFGNTTSAVALLKGAEYVPRTSSWVEVHLDAHRDFAKILTRLEEPH